MEDSVGVVVLVLESLEGSVVSIEGLVGFVEGEVASVVLLLLPVDVVSLDTIFAICLFRLS